MSIEIAVYAVGLTVLGALFVNHTRAFIAMYVCVLVFESLITYSLDLVVGSMRIHPLDAIIWMMFLCYPLRPRRLLHRSHRLIQIFVIIAAVLFLPAIWGYWGGASLRNLLRDCRPIIYLFSLLPFISVMRDEEDWQWFLTVFRKIVVVCAYLILFGLLTGWQMQKGASVGWQTAYTASGELARGYGVISSYVYFPFALYLDMRHVIWGEWRQWRKWTPLRKLSTLVLAIALLATFVRACLLAFFLMMFVSTVLIFHKSRRYRANVWKPWMLCAIGVVGLLSVAMVSPYAQSMVERGGSLVIPSLGGEKGKGTISARLRVIPFTFESFEDRKDMILGHGYGTQGLELWQLSGLNHNSYFWVIYHGGFLTLLLVIMGFLYLTFWTYDNKNYSFASRIDTVGVIVATFSFGMSTGLLFNQNGPQLLAFIVLFLAGCNASQYIRKRRDIRNRR